MVWQTKRSEVTFPHSDTPAFSTNQSRTCGVWSQTPCAAAVAGAVEIKTTIQTRISPVLRSSLDLLCVKNKVFHPGIAKSDMGMV